MNQIAEDLGQQIGVVRACEALGMARSSLYRARQLSGPALSRPTPARALSQAERETVRDVLNSERFADSAPRQVYATL